MVLQYDDFGPQVVAHELIGYRWYQWNNHGPDEGAEDSIAVVVYKNMTLAEAQAAYPITPAKQVDRRHIEAGRAVAFLTRQIDALERDADFDPETKRILLARFMCTRQRIESWRASGHEPVSLLC